MLAIGMNPAAKELEAIRQHGNRHHILKYCVKLESGRGCSTRETCAACHSAGSKQFENDEQALLKGAEACKGSILTWS